MAQLKQGTTIDGRIALHEGNTHAVAKSGSYNDLTNKPTIHTINDTTTTSTTNTWSAKKLNDTFATKLGSSATAVAANKLATARTITLGGDLTGSASFDGSANITISAEVKDNSHNHPYLPLTGGTLTGALTLSGAPTANLHAATKQYVDSILAANDAMVYKGVIDASQNPNYPAGQAGFTYKVSVAGRIGGTSGPKVEAGDMLVCIKDGSAAGDHATVGANWNILQNNIDGAVTGPSSAVAGRIATFDGTSGRLIKDSGFTIATSVPANAKFTDTVTTVNNTLTSDSTSEALSAAQGKTLKGLVDGKAASNHTHNYAGSSSAGGNANAAVKLATARSINGTNFDGTADITTANWGTARNITIGSSTKSVNGSANISWSLTEIGAAPSSHNHTSANITDATANATANMIVKRDGSGNASFNKSTVNSLAFGGNVTLQYNAQTESLDFVFPA